MTARNRPMPRSGRRGSPGLIAGDRRDDVVGIDRSDQAAVVDDADLALGPGQRGQQLTHRTVRRGRSRDRRGLCFANDLFAVLKAPDVVMDQG